PRRNHDTSVILMASIRLIHTKSSIDWIAFFAALTLSGLGLLTMNSFNGTDPFFVRQLIWIAAGVGIFFVASKIDWRFLRNSGVAASIYGVLMVRLLFLLLLGTAVKGARSWLSIGTLGIEPVEFVKLALIIALAKYFSRR